MKDDELKLMLKLIPDYVKHLKNNKKSLLGKIFGIFTIKADNISEVHVMLMENTLRFENTKNLKYIFDLKGSLVDRSVKGFTKPTTTLKDLNFMIAAKGIPDIT